MRRIAAAAFVSLVVVLIALPFTAAHTQVSLRTGSSATARPGSAKDSTVFVGTVRDAPNGKPVSSVSVSLQPSSPNVQSGALTNDQGHYVFATPRISVGTSVRLTARRIGFQSTTVIVVVTADTVHLDIVITPASGVLASITVNAPQTPLVERGQVGSGVVITYDQMVNGRVANVARHDTAGGPRRSSREQYDRIEDNTFLGVKSNPLSTFSIDVDRASYGNVRRMINGGTAPVRDAVRIEELINYFPYSIAAPTGAAPVAITTEVAPAPWQPKHQLVRIALKARDIETAKLPPNNLVFLIDVSGSMFSPEKLPLVKRSLRLLVDQLREQDRVAIVVYAGAAGLVLPSTSGAEKARIAGAIDALEAGGSTAGGAGLMLA